MTNDRKKYITYLHPKLYEQDAKTINYIDSLPQQLRGDFYRQSLITGAALSQIDPRLLSLISTLFSPNFDKNNLIALIEQLAPQSSNEEKHLTINREQPAESSTKFDSSLLNLKK
ncbi:plasmid partitioning/stability family protein [Providencia alcalifaciens]|nr:plasmid partitioning/stability family protein [Providencia alcalifaciens]ETT06932.1 plasmid stability protein [Providencia alcalifaciens F90-2004]EUD04074.1 plasmid stability protein [Providencia alcalifaciens RIMD 1656011]CAG9436634.1 hypothetical protein NVI2019_OGMBKCAO_04055 [Providencia alcalifaciens]CAG9436925.1 hypothetical protein NVI2019_KOLGMIGM_04116 [Providencia alcalifaciens]CAG9436930.1 hypothetical protein NVI2019_PLFLNFOB_04114 [Providencia alcalifaciens]